MKKFANVMNCASRKINSSGESRLLSKHTVYCPVQCPVPLFFRVRFGELEFVSQNGRHKQRSSQHTLARQKNIRKKKIGCSAADVRVQRSSEGSAQTCCKAGTSSNLGSAPQGGYAPWACSYEDMDMSLSECYEWMIVWSMYCNIIRLAQILKRLGSKEFFVF
jgi:hypothetical protein